MDYKIVEIKTSIKDNKLNRKLYPDYKVIGNKLVITEKYKIGSIEYFFIGINKDAEYNKEYIRKRGIKIL